MPCQPPLMAPGALIQASIISSVGSRIAAIAARAWSGVILAACTTRSTMVLIDLAPPAPSSTTCFACSLRSDRGEDRSCIIGPDNPDDRPPGKPLGEGVPYGAYELVAYSHPRPYASSRRRRY